MPDVVFSYCRWTGNGAGEEQMRKLKQQLADLGITSFSGDATSDDFPTEWLGAMNGAKVCIVLLSPEFFKSTMCKKELVAASKRAFRDESFCIITIVFGTLPDDFTQFKEGWFGSSEQDQKNANVVKEEMAQLLPRPTDGIFTTDYNANFSTLRKRLKNAGVTVSASYALSESADLEELRAQ